MPAGVGYLLKKRSVAGIRPTKMSLHNSLEAADVGPLLLKGYWPRLAPVRTESAHIPFEMGPLLIQVAALPKLAHGTVDTSTERLPTRRTGTISTKERWEPVECAVLWLMRVKRHGVDAAGYSRDLVRYWGDSNLRAALLTQYLVAGYIREKVAQKQMRTAIDSALNLLNLKISLTLKVEP
jgi:hypothetical protein